MVDRWNEREGRIVVVVANRRRLKHNLSLDNTLTTHLNNNHNNTHLISPPGGAAADGARRVRDGAEQVSLGKTAMYTERETERGTGRQTPRIVCVPVPPLARLLTPVICLPSHFSPPPKKRTHAHSAGRTPVDEALASGHEGLLEVIGSFEAGGGGSGGVEVEFETVEGGGGGDDGMEEVEEEEDGGEDGGEEGGDNGAQAKLAQEAQEKLNV